MEPPVRFLSLDETRAIKKLMRLGIWIRSPKGVYRRYYGRRASTLARSAEL